MTEPEAVFDPSQAGARRSIALLSVGALLGLAIAGYGLFTAKGTRSRSVPPEAIATVNQRLVLRSDFMTQTQVQYKVPYTQSTSEQRHKVLEDMISEELMVQRGLEMDLPSYDPDVRSALVAGVELEVSADVLARQPTEDELQQYYAAHRDRYSSEGVMRLRDLIAADPTDAATAASELRAGKALDGVMSRHALKDSGKFMKAGQVDTDDLYQFAVRAKFDDPLFQAALLLNSGQVSDPIREPDGVHLIFMTAHRPAVAQSFEQARSRVWNDLKQAMQSKVREANLAYLRGRADILVAPEFPR
jgi:hypothetical protein